MATSKANDPLAAYVPAAAAVLGQLRVDAKTNEHKAALTPLGKRVRRRSAQRLPSIDPGGLLEPPGAALRRCKECKQLN
jgi:hypothetical protein